MPATGVDEHRLVCPPQRPAAPTQPSPAQPSPAQSSPAQPPP
ncbi:hypothetical protein JHW43_000750 [Diplocarpon mali]|nr:hypothetical protein JHW43_000750 [Diplocarpon mali]